MIFVELLLHGAVEQLHVGAGEGRERQSNRHQGFPNRQIAYLSLSDFFKARVKECSAGEQSGLHQLPDSMSALAILQRLTAYDLCLFQHLDVLAPVGPEPVNMRLASSKTIPTHTTSQFLSNELAKS